MHRPGWATPSLTMMKQPQGSSDLAHLPVVCCPCCEGESARQRPWHSELSRHDLPPSVKLTTHIGTPLRHTRRISPCCAVQAAASVSSLVSCTYFCTA